MIIFIHVINVFCTNDLYFSDSDSFCFENKHWDKLNEAKLVDKSFLQGKKDYKDRGIIYGLFLAPKLKYWLTINDYGIIDEQKTFKGFTNVSDNLIRKEYFNMSGGDKLIAKLPLSWKKRFNMVVVIPHKMATCNKFSENILCDGCDKLVNQNKEFSANLNEWKREAPNELGQMLPWYITS